MVLSLVGGEGEDAAGFFLVDLRLGWMSAFCMRSNGKSTVREMEMQQKKDGIIDRGSVVRM